jgi:hypothetical protein
MTQNKVSLAEAWEATTLLAELLPFFPRAEIARRFIAAEIYNFVGTKEQLDWFLVAAARTIKKWEGLPPLRALYATRYEPDDGVRPTIELPGFTADELEAKHRLREMAENAQRFENYRRQALLAPPEDREAFRLPELKALAAPAPRTSLADPDAPHRSLKEREEDLASQKQSPRSEEERAELVRGIEAEIGKQRVM